MRVRWGAVRPRPGAVDVDVDAATCSPAPHGHRLATAVDKLPACRIDGLVCSARNALGVPRDHSCREVWKARVIYVSLREEQLKQLKRANDTGVTSNAIAM
jgi:hypothetical protein